MLFSTSNKKNIGDILVETGIINHKTLEKAIELQKTQGVSLETALIQGGVVDHINILKATAKQLNIEFVDLKTYPIKLEIIQKIPERIARRYRIIVLDSLSDGYLVGMVEPSDVIAYDELNKILSSTLKIAIINEDDLLHLFDLVYRRTEDISSFAEALKKEIKSETFFKEPQVVSANAAPVVKLLDSIFEDALQTGASDIHIEPDENQLRIRQRVDGVLQEHIIPGKEIMSALVSRIKLIANMNISEKRIPQDGRFEISIKGRKLDVRVAVMPVHFGEVAVLRILDQSKGILKLTQLGMEMDVFERIRNIIHKPNGMILVTGPTGSGKTTTLYGILNELNTAMRKIITIEDPVEYILPRINQIQVNHVIGLTFSSILRSVMRHDPDVIMVGEMRDEETVRIGLRAAMTGHLVFSTLHTNDALSSTVRLMDMGAEGFLVAGALRGVLAQRLVRKICDVCAVPYHPTIQEKLWISGFLQKPESVINFEFKQGKGCSRCNNSGYKGRTGIYEFLEVTQSLGDALRDNNTNLFMELGRSQTGFKSLTYSALECAIQGMTSLNEVFRISGEYQ